jgi:uncharacterized membrane protein
MKLFLNRIRDTLTDSFWFLPGLMALLAAFAALGTVALDHAIGNSYVKNIGWIWLGGPDGARSVLSVIAGSVMTVVSIVYSLTISVLAQTSSHYGPRVLRNFTSDRGVQFTLGTFIATFVYCLLVLRTVRSVQEEEFVPYRHIITRPVGDGTANSESPVTCRSIAPATLLSGRGSRHQRGRHSLRQRENG